MHSALLDTHFMMLLEIITHEKFNKMHYKPVLQSTNLHMVQQVNQMFVCLFKQLLSNICGYVRKSFDGKWLR